MPATVPHPTDNVGEGAGVRLTLRLIEEIKPYRYGHVESEAIISTAPPSRSA
jgi:hypothetical protein